MGSAILPNTFRFLLLSALLVLTLPFALGKVKYPKTAVCPIDNVTAKATGKTKPTNDPKCVLIDFQSHVAIVCT